MHENDSSEEDPFPNLGVGSSTKKRAHFKSSSGDEGSEEMHTDKELDNSQNEEE